MSVETSSRPVPFEKNSQSVDGLTGTQRLTAGLIEAAELLPAFRSTAKEEATRNGLKGNARRTFVREAMAELLISSADPTDELGKRRSEIQEMVAPWANPTEVSEFATAQRKARKELKNDGVLDEYLRRRAISEELVANLPLARERLRKRSILSGGITVSSMVAAYFAGKLSVNTLPNETLTALGAALSYAGYAAVNVWKGIENNRLLHEFNVGLNALSKFCYDHTRHGTWRIRLPGFRSKEVDSKKIAAGTGYGAWQVISEVPVGIGMYEAAAQNGAVGLGEYATGANLASIGWFGGEIAASWYARKKGEELTVAGLLAPKEKREKNEAPHFQTSSSLLTFRSSNHI